MKNVVNILLLSLLAASIGVLGACAADEEAVDDSEGAMSEDPNLGPDPGKDYVNSPLLAGANTKAWTARAADGREVATLRVSRDGAFTVRAATALHPWNGGFDFEANNLTLRVNNSGAETNTGALGGLWLLKTKGTALELFREDTTLTLEPTK